MGSAEQSAFFMPLLTDPKLELLQDPQPIGFDARTLMQYAGVPRRDGQGFVQVGIPFGEFSPDHEFGGPAQDHLRSAGRRQRGGDDLRGQPASSVWTTARLGSNLESTAYQCSVLQAR
jgi:hypothetical protein